MTLRTWSASSLLVLLLATAGRADTVVVSNGDELHGTIVKIEKGKLFLKTGYAGTISIV